MFTKLYSGLLNGINSELVKVEIDISSGLPSFSIVGKTDTTIIEATKRIKSALKNNNLKFPSKKITVNLSPAYVKKEGSFYDLAIAAGLIKLILNENINFDNYFIFGELSLDGNIYPVNGSLPLILSAIKNNFKKIILPFDNINEINLINKIKPDIIFIPLKNIKELIEIIKGKEQNYIYNSTINNEKDLKSSFNLDYKDIKGLIFEKFALTVAVAGRHNLLMIGPPGSGKSMLANRIPTILPKLNLNEQLETASIWSLNGLDISNILKSIPPFRSPHHSISYAGLIGGGSKIKPGEISLAHNGVLFLDELAEFSKHTLETLRQPLENKKITISRAESSITFPANFLFIAASNPCPCGYLGDKEKNCICSISEIKRYISKFSGPLLDRFDIIIRVDRLNFKQLFDYNNINQKSSKEMKKEVISAIKFKKERKQVNYNSELNSKDFTNFIINNIDKKDLDIVYKAAEKFKLSARVINKILKIARTIADLKQEQKISLTSLSQALNLRKYDILSLI